MTRPRTLRPVRRPLSAARAFLAGEAAGGVVLIAATVAAMLIANLSLTSGPYAGLLHGHLGPLTVHRWIDDGLMALFFLLVGLEIKRDFVDGQLSHPRRRTLPFIVAAAGMVVPALVYLAIAGHVPGLARGWAIPAATDIAFAVGVLALLGPRVPPALKIFLTAVAIVDDMGAVAIIALAYTEAIDLGALAGAAGVLALMLACNRRGVRWLAPYLAGFVLLWWLLLLSGVHATIAGVATAMLVPITRSPGAPDDAGSPLHRLEHALGPWVAFGIVPLFALANAGIPLHGLSLATLGEPLVVAVGAGLFLGKQAGVFGSIWIADRMGIAKRPGGASWTQIYGLSLLAGIGFTMSLFIGGLAFPDDPLRVDAVKLGVLAGSLLSALGGFVVLRTAHRRVGM
ncbi:Na+/H+ antiporter NhaA [uncultured Sphingomonas sp.]|uniref:Na+/H+ antiporter NhaA n=1 Tax=uncultured Sphingomonas sp. TaxID=158754 RepID=UPI00260C2165|nr:Na+/H+ antiporter NhaA [uncultured Sphingomonas sp.]